MVGALYRWPAHAGPTNDNFADRLPISGSNVTVTASIAGATHEPGEPNPDGISPGASVWWEWTAPADGSYLVSVTVPGAAGFAAAAFAGTALTNLEALAWATNSVSGSAQFALRASAGAIYCLAVVSPPLEQYTTATLSLVPGPANDDFANRSPIAGGLCCGAWNNAGRHP